MSEGHIQRMLLAERDVDAAEAFRAVAAEAVKLYAAALDTDPETGTPQAGLTHGYRSWSRARRELKELNRVCLRHAARRLDASYRAGGKESEMESAVMLFDITHPVRERV